MATRLFLRKTTLGTDPNNPSFFKAYDSQIVRGAAMQTTTTNTAASGTEIGVTETAGAGVMLEFISPPLAAGFTLNTTDTITFNLWGKESNLSANVSFRVRLYRQSRSNIQQEFPGSPFNFGTELTTSAAVKNWTGTVSSAVTFFEVDRILVRVYLTNVGTMAAGFNATMEYDGPTNAADGDSWIELTNTVTFKPELPPLSPFANAVVFPSDACHLVRGHPLAPRFAWEFRGNPAEGALFPELGDASPGKMTNFGGQHETRLIQRLTNGLRFRGGSYHVALGPISRLFGGSLTNWSVVVGCRFHSVSLEPSAYVICGTNLDGTTNQIVMHTPGTSGNLRFDYSTDANINVNLTDLTTVDSVLVYTAGPRGKEIWRNGVRVANAAITTPLTADPTNPFRVGGIAGTGPAADMTVSFLYIYWRQLTSGQIAWLTRAPF